MEEEKDPLDPQTVFTIKHSDIPKGLTQCPMQEHIFEDLNDNEIICRKCNTVLIVK
jgi:hypothetical protein